MAEARPFRDQRGWFYRAFCADDLQAVLGSRRIVQANVSRTEAVGAVRGLHYQAAPHAEVKLVRCLRGRVWDVAVDLRRNSPTFLQWHAEELSPESARMLVIPEGCAHGFQVLEEGSELLYLHTASYSKESEGGVRFDDPRIGVAWPLPVAEMSERDRAFALLPEDYRGIIV